MRILLTGRNGQVGSELERALRPLGRVLATGRTELDLADTDAIRVCVGGFAPDVIVNAAAYTDVDRAEREPELAAAINAAAPAVFAEEAARLQALLVHFSTDYVFDGEGARPYREDDGPNPLNAYGRTKWEGERAIAAAGCRHLILRTSWVYAARGRNFLTTIRRLMRERDGLDVVDDQIGAPTWARHVAEATARMLGQPEARGAGVYHLTAAGHTSWYGFARAIAAADAEHRGPAACVIRPVSSAEYGAVARRPRNSRLDNTRITREYGIVLPAWESGLRSALEADRADDSAMSGDQTP